MVHLHALSPSEIQHAARRSKFTILQALGRLRDAGLDSASGRRRRDLGRLRPQHHQPHSDHDRGVLGIMREAQRIGMSTTAR